jgi:hypothetical protein
MIIGAGLLPRIFDEKCYHDLEGGLLEGLSKLLDASTRLLVYPLKKGDACTTAKTFAPEKTLQPIYRYFADQGWIADMSNCDEIAEFIGSDQISQMIAKGDRSWLKHVPVAVAEMIKKENLFQLRAGKATKS